MRISKTDNSSTFEFVQPFSKYFSPSFLKPKITNFEAETQTLLKKNCSF
jgi:hypothetical protein